MLRRTFLASAGAAAAPAIAAPVPLRLGMDAYSLRAWGWKALQSVEYAAGLKLDAIQFSNLTEYESLEPAYLGKVRDAAAAANISLQVGLGSICPISSGFSKRWGTPEQYLNTAFRVAGELRTNIVRAYVGSSADRVGPMPIERHIEETLKVLKPVRSAAVDRGIRIALENHSGDLQARELRDLIEAAGRDWVGCCFDSGNPMMNLEDPMLTFEILGPYAITTHLRDWVLFEHPRGAAWQWVAMGDGMMDWPRFLEKFRATCPNAPLLLENITGRPPRVVPFLEPDFWKPFANVRASDFATYVALARRGHPLMEPMVMEDVPGAAPSEYREALKQQQKRDLEKGIAFARKLAGVGVNWRPV